MSIQYIGSTKMVKSLLESQEQRLLVSILAACQKLPNLPIAVAYQAAEEMSQLYLRAFIDMQQQRLRFSIDSRARHSTDEYDYIKRRRRTWTFAIISKAVDFTFPHGKCQISITKTKWQQLPH